MGIIAFAGAAHSFDIQGHRGARGLSPENTLPGFAKALSIGVTTLELDLAATRDGHLVVMHNPRFEPEVARLKNGDWLQKSSPSVHSMTLEEAKHYDVGRLNPNRKYAKRYPFQQALDGISVPTLDEVFELVNKSGNKTVGFNIEVKINPKAPELTLPPGEFVRLVVDVVNRYKMQKRVVVQSFDWRVLQQVQTLSPGIKTSYLTANQSWLNNLQTGMPGSSPWLAGIDIDDYGGNAARAIKAAGGTIWSSYHKEVTSELINQAQELGLSVNVWTVNEPERMRQLINMGVDGIITDYPDRLRLVLQELGMDVPEPTPLIRKSFN